MIDSRLARKWISSALAMAAVVLLGGCALSLQSLPKISSVGSNTYSLHAVFANVLNLPDDAQVRNGAEVIGQVSNITTKNFQADLTLDIKDGVHIPVGNGSDPVRQPAR
jgi:phospholipid/cholesterol/gamma-HCH transport system substrate-binding protein